GRRAAAGEDRRWRQAALPGRAGPGARRATVRAGPRPIQRPAAHSRQRARTRHWHRAGQEPAGGRRAMTESEIFNTLRASGYRLTAPRRKLVDLLLQAEAPLTADEIYQRA